MGHNVSYEETFATFLLLFIIDEGSAYLEVLTDITDNLWFWRKSIKNIGQLELLADILIFIIIIELIYVNVVTEFLPAHTIKS